MSDESFFGELAGLVKKHFFKKKKKTDKAPRKKLFSGRFAKNGVQKPSVSVGSVQHDSANISDPAKQKKVEALCEKLFAQKDMISSGKLNFLGLDKIKKRLGKSWEGVKPIVYDTVDSAIRKYMEDGDLFIRYREDVYLIIFASASHEEAQIKSALIAEEIRRSLFDTAHTELREMEIQRDVRTVKTETLRGGQGLDKAVDKIFSGKIDVPAAHSSDHPDKVDFQEKIISHTKTAEPVRNASWVEESKTSGQTQMREPKVEIIEVDAYRKSIGQFDQEQLESGRYEFSFIPVWDTKRSYLSTYICVLKNDKMHINPYQTHKDIYSGMSNSQKLECDIAVLRHVINEYKSVENADNNMFLCCPVHYETLLRDSSFTEYKIACQKIPPGLREYLFFIVMDCPQQVHKMTLSKFVGPLKNYCRFFCGEVPFDSKVDFVTYRTAGFDSVGVNLPQLGKNYEKMIVPVARNFAQQAKKNYIPFIFIFGVYDHDIINQAVFPDFDFAAGSAIHTHVHKPDGIYKFRHQDIYSKMNEKIGSGRS